MGENSYLKNKLSCFIKTEKALLKLLKNTEFQNQPYISELKILIILFYLKVHINMVQLIVTYPKSQTTSRINKKTKTFK